MLTTVHQLSDYHSTRVCLVWDQMGMCKLSQDIIMNVVSPPLVVRGPRARLVVRVSLSRLRADTVRALQRPVRRNVPKRPHTPHPEQVLLPLICRVTS